VLIRIYIPKEVKKGSCRAFNSLEIEMEEFQELDGNVTV
jgi:hypothetical protein